MSSNCGLSSHQARTLRGGRFTDTEDLEKLQNCQNGGVSACARVSTWPGKYGMRISIRRTLFELSLCTEAHETNCARVSGWSCTHEPYNKQGELELLIAKIATVTELVLWLRKAIGWSTTTIFFECAKGWFLRVTVASYSYSNSATVHLHIQWEKVWEISSHEVMSCNIS